MAKLIRSLDRTKTSLGAVSEWPNCLQSAVSLMLPSHAQIVLFWGADFIALYNDAYAPAIGNKHPRALGRPARENWGELWEDLEPLLQRVLSTGETVSAKDRPFHIERHGYAETVYFDISYSAVRDPSGAVQGVLCIVSETTERKKAEAALERLAAIVASSDDAIMSIDLDTNLTSWNRGAERLFGYTADEVIGKSVTILVPEDRPDEEPSIIARVRRGERIEPHETKRRHKDGRLIDVLLTVSPVRDASGKIVGASKISHDITERKEAERLQRILMGELKHRVKNVLATVMAIARQTFGSEASAETRKAFDARLLSLSKAHDLLTAESWNGADLSDIIAEVLAPYESEQFEISGPQVRLPPKVAVAFSLAFHELATNAAKYGALSADNGKVAITWTVRADDPASLELHWEESGGPAVAKPSRKGFGSRLIEGLLSMELDGETQITYEPSGVVCEIKAPLNADWDTIGEQAA